MGSDFRQYKLNGLLILTVLRTSLRSSLAYELISMCSAYNFQETNCSFKVWKRLLCLYFRSRRSAAQSRDIMATELHYLPYILASWIDHSYRSPRIRLRLVDFAGLQAQVDNLDQDSCVRVKDSARQGFSVWGSHWRMLEWREFLSQLLMQFYIYELLPLVWNWVDKLLLIVHHIEYILFPLDRISINQNSVSGNPLPPKRLLMMPKSILEFIE